MRRPSFGFWIPAILACLVFRVAVVLSWQASAGDGLQYYALAQELVREHRFAYAAAPAPLTWSRLPGYPLFLAFIAVPFTTSLKNHLVAAALWNVVLDLGTALLLARMLIEAGWPKAARWAFFGVAICPLMLFLSCYGLSESLATFLAAAQLFFIWRMLRGDRVLRHATMAGFIAGLSELVRADSLFMWPAIGLAILFSGETAKKIALGSAACVLAAVAVFAAWPIRNQVQFGSPHPLGTRWVRQDGTPQPYEMEHWMRTWSSAQPGQSFIHEVIVPHGAPIDVRRPGILLPVMFDSAAERSRVIALFAEYNRTGITPALDRSFGQLARERERRAPLRSFVALPLSRLLSEWKPLPAYELPVNVGWLGLPAWRGLYDVLDRLLLLLALVGAAVLWRSAPRLLWILLLTVAVRSVLPAWLHPFPVQRYLVEVYPVILSLTALGAHGLFARAQSHARARLQTLRVPPPRSRGSHPNATAGGG